MPVGDLLVAGRGGYGIIRSDIDGNSERAVSLATVAVDGGDR